MKHVFYAFLILLFCMGCEPQPGQMGNRSIDLVSLSTDHALREIEAVAVYIKIEKVKSDGNWVIWTHVDAGEGKLIKGAVEADTFGRAVFMAWVEIQKLPLSPDKELEGN